MYWVWPAEREDGRGVFLILDRYGICLPTLQSRREGESRAAQRPEQPDGGNAVARRTQDRRGNAPKQTGV
jgi:hypothetical protein